MSWSPTQNVQTKARRKPKQPHFADNWPVVDETRSFAPTVLGWFAHFTLLNCPAIRGFGQFWPYQFDASGLQLCCGCSFCCRNELQRKCWFIQDKPYFAVTACNGKIWIKNGVWKTILSSSFHGVVIFCQRVGWTWWRAVDQVTQLQGDGRMPWTEN